MLSNLELLWSIFLSFLPILVKFSEKVLAKNSFLQRCSAIVIKVTQDHSGASRILLTNKPDLETLFVYFIKTVYLQQNLVPKMQSISGKLIDSKKLLVKELSSL